MEVVVAVGSVVVLVVAAVGESWGQLPGETAIAKEKARPTPSSSPSLVPQRISASALAGRETSAPVCQTTENGGEKMQRFASFWFTTNADNKT